MPILYNIPVDLARGIFKKIHFSPLLTSQPFSDIIFDFLLDYFKYMLYNIPTMRKYVRVARAPPRNDGKDWSRTMKTAPKKNARDESEIASKEQKKKALETAINKIEKDFGKGSIIKMGSSPQMNVSAVSTGSVSLDLALGVGGFPRGRIIEIYGPESSGKTTLALHAIAEVQKIGGEAAFIDAEHALDPVYAKALGVDIADFGPRRPVELVHGIKVGLAAAALDWLLYLDTKALRSDAMDFFVSSVCIA